MNFFIFILDLPDEKPRITGIKEKYQIGETMEALFTSWQSHPPANLTWFINEEKVMMEIMGTSTLPLSLRREKSTFGHRKYVKNMMILSHLSLVFALKSRDITSNRGQLN